MIIVSKIYEQEKIRIILIKNISSHDIVLYHQRPENELVGSVLVWRLVLKNESNNVILRINDNDVIIRIAKIVFLLILIGIISQFFLKWFFIKKKKKLYKIQIIMTDRTRILEIESIKGQNM